MKALLALLGIGVAGTALAAKELNNSPSDFDAVFQKYGAQYGVDWKFLKTISMNESSLGKAKSVARGLAAPYDVEGSKSTDGLSWGIMQVTVTTARDFDKTASAIKLNDPDYSVRIASQFIASLKKQFPNSDRDVAMAYNQGAGNQKKFIAAEKAGTLGSASYPAARSYWEKFRKNYSTLFG